MNMRWICAAVVSGIMLAGCGSKDEGKTPTTRPAASTTLPPAAMTPLPPPVGVPPGTPTPPVVAPVAVPPVTVPPVTVPPAPAVETPAPAAGGVTPAEAPSVIQKIQDLMKSGKFDQADAQLKKLEANQSSYPASVQATIANLRKALNMVKSPTSLPSGLGKLPSIGG